MHCIHAAKTACDTYHNVEGFFRYLKRRLKPGDEIPSLMNRLGERLKNGPHMFTSKAGDIAIVEERFQRIDEPPARFICNYEFF